MADGTKICQRCGATFSRPDYSPATFARMRFCSRSCGSTRPASERFDALWVENHVTGCHNWTGAVTQTGYGTFWDGENYLRAHRYSYKRAFGVDPSRLVVMHKCDNPRCVNPAHLVLGTQRDNLADMHAKGRGARPYSRLTDDDIRAIRADRASKGRDLARKYNVVESVISTIRSGKVWSGVT